MNIKNKMYRLLKSILFGFICLNFIGSLNAQDYYVGGFETSENGALYLDPAKGGSSSITSAIVPNPSIGINNPSANCFGAICRVTYTVWGCAIPIKLQTPVNKTIMQSGKFFLKLKIWRNEFSTDQTQPLNQQTTDFRVTLNGAGNYNLGYSLCTQKAYRDGEWVDLVIDLSKIYTDNKGNKICFKDSTITSIYLSNTAYWSSTAWSGNFMKTLVDEIVLSDNPDSRIQPVKLAVKYNHFIMYGQSLSMGGQSYPPLSTVTVDGNYMIGSQPWINYGNPQLSMKIFNPLKSTMAASVPYRDLESIGECPVIGAVNHIQLKAKTAPNLLNIATSCGTGGKTIDQLSKESDVGNYYESDFLHTIREANYEAVSKGSGIVCPAIFWMQGESNSSIGARITDKDGYKKAMVQLKNDMQNDIVATYHQNTRPPFITYQMSGQYLSTFKEMPISLAQLEASNEYNDIICAGPVYPMTDRGGHLDANGYRWFGEMLGKVYYRTQIAGETFKPLQPKAYYKTGKAKEIQIEFLVQHPPLVIDTLLTPMVKDYGFEIQLNGVRVALNKINITDNFVTLQLDRDIVGTDAVEVFYAGINQVPRGHGNLRDSDPYQSFYTYLDLDKKDVAGQFIYPRGDANGLDRNGIAITTLRPTPEPKDNTGNVIYEQNYPLYNFCVCFYKKLDAMSLTLNPGSSIQTLKMGHGVKEVFIRNHKLIIQLNELVSCNLKVYDMCGRLVFGKKLNTLNTEVDLPLNSAYNIVIEGRGEGAFNTKVVVN
jgi:hypothetical protein